MSNNTEPFKITRQGSRGYFRTVLRIGKSEFVLMSDGTAFDCRTQQLELRKALTNLLNKYISIGAEGARGEDKD